MSFFSKSRDRERGDQGGGGGQKSQFYVEFLGWMECRGLQGRRYADPVIHELRRRQKKTDKPPKLTIRLTPKELLITQDIEEDAKKSGSGKGKGGSNIRKIKFPAIPARDVTYVVQASRPQDGQPDDIVACIYLGFMPRTQRSVHVHVYRFDEPATAATFARLMAGLVGANASRIREVGRELAERGEIDDLRLTSSDGMSERATVGTDSGSGAGSVYSSEDGSPTFGSDEMEDDLRSMADVREFDSVASELKQRLKMVDGPMLLPPKDYDTISRARGNLKDINSRRCLNLSVVGEGRLADEVTPPSRDRNGSVESGVDVTSPASDAQLQKQPPTSKSPGSTSSGSPRAGAPPENGFVYPPRVPRPPPAASHRSPELPRPAHARQSSLESSASTYGTHSSRASSHSNHSGEGDAYASVYRRSDSGGYPGPASHSRSDSFDRAGPDDLFPPTDYEDSPGVGLTRLEGLPPPPTLPRPASFSSVGPGGPSANAMLMRSLPAGFTHNEMVMMKGGNARHPRVGRGASSELDDYAYAPQRAAQPPGFKGGPEHGQGDYKSPAADYVQGGGPIRRVNSYR